MEGVASSIAPDTIYPVVAVNAVVFDRAGRVLLTQRADNALWCLPGGLMVFGETVEDAMRRELLEETGINPDRLRFVGIYSQNNLVVVPTAKRCSVIIVFACNTTDQTPHTSEEVIAVRYFDVAGLPTDIIPTHPRRILDAVNAAAGAVIS